MTLPNAPSLLFLLWLLAFLPAAAFRSARRVAAMRAAGADVDRTRVWIGTIVTQCALFALTWITARSFGGQIVGSLHVSPRDVIAALAALSACFLLRQVGRAWTSEEERRRLVVYRIAPRDARERALWGLAVVVASVAEEAAYRGVAMQILWYALGDPWLAALISSLAFAAAHAMQGWKSALVVFCIATVMHALVALTGTLVLAILVHAAYHFVAGSLIAKEAGQTG